MASCPPGSLIRLVAFDIDQTLSADGLTISEPVRLSVQRAAEQGAEIVLATGRMYQSALKFAQILDVDASMVCYHGAVMKINDQAALQINKTLPDKTVRRILQYLETQPVEILINVMDELYSPQSSPGALTYARTALVPLHISTDLRAVLKPASVLKIIFIATPGSVLKIADGLRAHLPTGFLIFETSPILGEVIPTGVDKSRALKAIARQKNIPLRQVMAFGDNESDAGMLEAAGIGVAMGNANSQLKAIANLVTSSVTEDGVSQVLDQYFPVEAKGD